jgi:osmoprotectant transport system permease protein
VIRALEVGLRRGRRGLVVTALAALLGLCTYTAASFAVERLAGNQHTVTIGAKAFTEQYILSELMAQRIARETGAPSRTLQSLGSTVAFDALRSGDLDVYVDYSGTIWATIMKRRSLPGGRLQVLDAVGRYLRDEHGIILLGSLGFENTYALGMRGAQARALGVERIGQLAAQAPHLEIGGDYEFFQRAEWKALVQAYGLVFRSQRSMDPALMYQALAEGEVDVISAFSTDGRIAAYDITLLEDERGVIPPYDAIVLVSRKLAEDRPAVVEALRGLLGAIDADAMRRMNLAVDGEGLSPAEVAAGFLADLGG